MPVNTDINWGEQIGSNVVGGFTIGSIFGASKYYWSLGPVHNTEGNLLRMCFEPIMNSFESTIILILLVPCLSSSISSVKPVIMADAANVVAKYGVRYSSSLN